MTNTTRTDTTRATNQDRLDAAGQLTTALRAIMDTETRNGHLLTDEQHQQIIVVYGQLHAIRRSILRGANQS